MVDSYQNDNVTDIVQIRTKAANLALVILRYNIGKMHIYVILALNRTRMCRYNDVYSSDLKFSHVYFGDEPDGLPEMAIVISDFQSDSSSYRVLNITYISDRRYIIDLFEPYSEKNSDYPARHFQSEIDFRELDKGLISLLCFYSGEEEKWQLRHVD